MDGKDLKIWQNANLQNYFDLLKTIQQNYAQIVLKQSDIASSGQIIGHQLINTKLDEFIEEANLDEPN